MSKAHVLLRERLRFTLGNFEICEVSETRFKLTLYQYVKSKNVFPYNFSFLNYSLKKQSYNYFLIQCRLMKEFLKILNFDSYYFEKKATNSFEYSTV